jgi:hypothetical protein
MAQRHTLRNAINVLVLFTAACAGAQTVSNTEPVAGQHAIPQEAAPKMPIVGGTEMDRVVAIVNGDLILDSDVDEERRFEAFQPYREAPQSSRERSIERLVNRQLILQQSRLQPEDAFSDAEVDKEIDSLKKDIPECKQYACDTTTGWVRFLAAHGFTPESLRARWVLRMQVLRFVAERFKQGIRISDADIKSYYEKQMLPVYAKKGVTPPELSTISDRIQEVLLQQQVSLLLSDWLKSLRAQGQVVILHPGESAP